MNIDMAALHAIEADKGISVDVVVDTIKSALLTAYRHTEGHEADARIEIDRKTGVVKVMARETDDDGNLISEWDDTPEGFGRIAATTARQVILQRLRDAENEPFVYIATGQDAKGQQQFARRKVKLGESHDGKTQIISGLQTGDHMVANGSLFLQFANSLQ